MTILSNLMYCFLLLGIGIYYLPSSLNPVIWTDPFPLPTLTGTLKSNEILMLSKKRGHNQITAPESMAIDSDTGYVFASLNDGRVVCLNEKGTWEADIFMLGAINEQLKSNTSLVDHMKWCQSKAQDGSLPWNVNWEKSCGRPLGLRLIKDEANRRTLFILDAYYGLYTVQFGDDLRIPQSITHHFDSKFPISKPDSEQSSDNVALLEIKFFNDLDVFGDMIYFSDSSYMYHRSQNRQEVLDGAARGRLFAFDVTKKQLTVLACGLHFPNGIQFQPSATNSESLLVVDSTRFRILKVNIAQVKTSNELIQSCDEYGSVYQHLKQAKTMSPISTFLDHGPGFMDNIRLLQPMKYETDNSPPHYLVGIGAKSTKPFSLLWWSYQNKWSRDLIGRILPMKYVEKLIPKYGLIIVVDNEGNIIHSLHDPSGKIMYTISEAQRNPVTGDIWMGSHSNPYIGILSKEDSKLQSPIL